MKWHKFPDEKPDDNVTVIALDYNSSPARLVLAQYSEIKGWFDCNGWSDDPLIYQWSYITEIPEDKKVPGPIFCDECCWREATSYYEQKLIFKVCDKCENQLKYSQMKKLNKIVSKE